MLAASLLALTACAPRDDDTAVEEECAPGVPAILPVTEGGLIYEMYLRSFKDGDGDGHGDLLGLTEKLPYLQQLGVEAVWLMPIFPADGPGGYDVSDYRGIDEDYGTQAEMEGMLAAASALGIRVLFDAPINHTSTSHPWFEAAAADPDSLYRDVYLFSDEQYDEERWYAASGGGWYYAYFGSAMPDLDWTTTAVQLEMQDMMTDWLTIGVGGYRLDAVIQLIEADGVISDSADTHCMLRELYKNLKGVSPNAIIVSEAWNADVLGASSYLGDLESAEADWVLDVPRHEVMEAMWTEGSAEPLRELLRAEVAAQTLLRVAPYMGNHDVFRLPTRVPDAAARRAWMVAHVLLPGHPVLYYGEELDLPQEDVAEGYDLPQRRPLPWSANLNGDFSTGSPWYPLHSSYLDGINVADELADPESMLSVTRAVAAIRRSSAAVRSDQIELPEVSDPAIFAFSRRTEEGADDVLVVMNVSDTEVPDVTLSVEGEWIDLHRGAPYSADGTLSLGSMRAYDYIVLGAQDFGGIVVPGPR